MHERICTFCGHRNVFDLYAEERAKKEIEKLIEQGFTVFYSGGMVAFA